uniref:Integrase catalytic domain-containing protein n=1 Tax=Tanacetum cinerariifolium TaxID=118510 RepID=A0A6L2JG71_TANCI|nr:hypothetical protein [Tanacetum cinerariifolium]
MTHPNPQRHVVPTVVLTRSKLVPLTTARPVTTAVPHNNVTRPRPAKTVVTKPHSPPRRTINRSSSPKPSNFPPKLTTIKAPKFNAVKRGNPQHALKDKGVINSGCSRHMTGNMSYLSDFEAINGGYVAFGGNPKGGKITRKGKFRTDTKCIVLSSDFKLPDDKHATLDESNLWHRRLSHINFKTMNKLIKGNLVRGLPLKVFENNHTCVACKKGKQHTASCKTKPVSSVSQPLQRLHMDLFGPTFVKSLNKKSYYLVVTDDYSMFTWVFLLATKDETSPILKTFITGIENQLSLKVKIIRSDNGIEFKNQDLNQFCGIKRIKREFSVPKTPQQNDIAKRKNMTLIEAAKTMLADSLLPILFWAEVVNTACYVQNRVLVTNPHNKTPYELLHSGTPSIGFMRPFGCPVTILNTLDPLGKFDRKADEGFLVGYSNINDDTTFEVKEPEFEVKKPDINEVNAASTQVPAVEQISTNSTNTFSVAGPYNTVVSLTLAKSSYVDLSQYPDDLNMPALEEITYSDDEEDVGAEADFTNLETTITVSPIPTTRVHKDHHMQKVWVIVDLPNGKRAIGFEDPDYSDKVYKVVKALYGLHQAPRAWYKTLANYLLENGFQRGKIGQTLFIKKQKGDILLVQVYVDDIIFGSTNKDLSMIGSLMYLTSSRPDIMFTICACARFQVTPKASHLHAVSDYAGASLDRKSTTWGCQFLRCRLISWQCKKQTVVATSSTEAEYVAAASCCAQVLWIQNQLLDYGIILNVVSSKFLLFGLTNRCCSLNAVRSRNASEGFDQILDFLNASAIKKKVIITEATVREALRLDEAESIDCLPNEEIFTELARMGTTWNEFSSSMASAVICLAIGRKFNFSKYIFDSIVRNVDSSSKFYMVGKGFFEVETPLFKGMLVPQQVAADVNDVDADNVPANDVVNVADDDVNVVLTADAEPTSPSPPPTTPPPLQEQPSTSQVSPTPPPSLIAQPSSPLQQQQPSQPSYDAAILTDLLNTLLKTYTTLTKKVEALEQDKEGIIELVDVDKDVTLEEVDIKKNTDVQGRLEKSQAQVYHIDLEHANKVLSMQDDEPEPFELKEDKGKGILVQEPKPLKKQAQIKQDEAYVKELEAELNKNINWDDVIEQVKRKGKEDNVVLRYQALKRKPQTEAQARKNMMVYLKNMAGFKMDYFKGMSYDDIHPIFEKYFNSNVAFLEKNEEVEELKKHLQIIPNDDDDVYTEATPLALKIVKERFASSKPKNISNDFMLTTLKAMFEKPDVQAQVWKNQRDRRYPLTRFTLDQMLNNFSFGVDAVEDFKEYTLRDYCCWLKTYCCRLKLKLLDDAADIKLRLLEQSADVVQLVSAVQIVKTVSIRVTTVMYKFILVNPWSIKGSLRQSLRCQKPGRVAARLGCAETKVATWDDLAFKLIILGWNVKHRQIATFLKN